MLILTRRINEVIMINEDIKITILDIDGNQVHIGFEAPKEVSIHREEIWQRIQADKLLTEDKE